MTTSSKLQTADDATAQLTDMQCELDSLRRQLNRSQRLATMGTMAAMIAHEFNNILTPVVNYAQLAQRNPALVDKALARAAEGGRRATTICDAILGMSGPDAAGPQKVNLSRLITQTLDAMVRAPQRDCIELRVSVPADLTLETRPVELQQVLLNLLVNARAALLAKSGMRRLEISAEAGDAEITISVCDNGVGMAQKTLAKIFEPFFTTKSDDGGHGLGLAICKDIVQDLGGRITVRSSAGKGATFTVVLPR